MATTANALIHTLKLILMSTGVLFIAILVTPQIFNFTAAQLPTIWSSVRSWLRPPYLYVIINGIIITIAASSRIHHHYKHPHAAAAADADAEEVRHVHHHDVHSRSSNAVSVQAYSYAEPKTPIVSMPAPDISPFPVPVDDHHSSLAGFGFSFGAFDSENHATAEVVMYDETTKIGARETASDEHVADDEEEKAIATEDHVLEEKLRNYDLASVEGSSVEPEVVPRRSVQTSPSPPPQQAPLARQETFEVVSSFFQSQIEKPLPAARFGQNGRKPSTLTSLDETTTFGAKESRKLKEAKPEKMENYNFAPRKTPSPPPRTSPLARQETSEIVSSFFQSQIEKPSPVTRFGQNRKVTDEGTRTSSDETATLGGVNEVIKMEKVGQNYSSAPQTTPSRPQAPLARQETSEIVSSFFQSQIEKPPASARFGHHRKATRSTPEGGKALRVAKPKRNETLESTWKTITEGRHMPLTRHLKKSDTWENHSRQPASSDPSTPSMVMKSETFTDRTNHSAVASAVAAKLKKDPSLSQDELNRRVEAFINKVNEEMRLQRQQSMQQFMDMINRGSH